MFPAVAFDTILQNIPILNTSQSWFIVFINSVFSVFDTVGRKMGGLKMFDMESTGIKILTLSRIIFIFTFYMIAFKQGFLYSDWFVIINMVLFAFTNGYAATLCAVKAPGTVPVNERG